jgi:hypothetical protein
MFLIANTGENIHHKASQINVHCLLHRSFSQELTDYEWNMTAIKGDTSILLMQNIVKLLNISRKRVKQNPFVDYICYIFILQ